MSRNVKYINLEFDDIINPLQANIPFIYPWKHQKISSFLKFWESIENEYWPETGLVRHKFCAEGNKTISVPLPKTFSSYQ